jgi:hypothetical protein
MRLWKERRIAMDYKALAEVIRRFESLELLAIEIETLENGELDIDTVDDLTEFLQDELDYSCE